MSRAGCAIGFALALAGCSQSLGKDDIVGVYAGTMENGRAYRLEMRDSLDYRFCRPDDTQCADPEFLGSYEVVRLGAQLIVTFNLLCIAPDGNCKTYEAKVTGRGPASVKLDFVDETDTSHVFVKQRQTTAR